MSVSTIDSSGFDKGDQLRFSPVFNFQNWIHADLGKYFGVFTGIAIRNVGFIYKEPDSDLMKKFRTYNLGIPVGIKLGNMQKTSVFAGYEIEIPLNYKEKTFIDERKVDKFNIWFSDRTPLFMHSLMAGIQNKRGVTLKFKYYLTSFFNSNYQSKDVFGNLYKPFLNFNANVMYASITVPLFKNKQFYWKKATSESPVEARF